MRLSSGFLIILLCSCPLLFPPTALAQAAPSSQPDTTAEPVPQVSASVTPQQVAPGQSARLRITVLVPTYMPKPVAFPSLDMANLQVALPERSTTPTSERIDGQTWSGVTRSYQLTPLAPGNFVLNREPLEVTYSNSEDGTPIARQLNLPALSLTSTVPEAAQDLDPYVAATALHLEQTLNIVHADTARADTTPADTTPADTTQDKTKNDGRTEDSATSTSTSSASAADGKQPIQLQSGDSLRREISITLEGGSALLIPALLEDTAPVGLGAYPESPKVDMNANGGTRREAITYVAEGVSEGELPAIRLRWFNLQSGTIEEASVPSVHVSAEGSPLDQLRHQSVAWKSIILSTIAGLVALSLSLWILIRAWRYWGRTYWHALLRSWQKTHLPPLNPAGRSPLFLLAIALAFSMLVQSPGVMAQDTTKTGKSVQAEEATKPPHGQLPEYASNAAGYAPDGSCASCHQAEAEAWKDSDHGWSMREATEENVLGDFEDASFEDGPVKARFFHDDEGFKATLEGPDDPAKTYRIRYTFGYSPLQQYLVALPGGKLQGLTIAWDSRPEDQGGQRWFSLYPGQAFTPDDPLHWRGRYQNWNAMCADCHSTNLQKNYDEASDTFATTWNEQNVGCQSCHGPAQSHLDWANGVKNDPAVEAETREAGTKEAETGKAGTGEDAPSTEDMGLAVDLKNTKGPALVEQCATCHSRRQMLGVGPGPGHGKPLTDIALPSLLSEGLYHADGQIQGEVYVYGSFVQSRMYEAGVACSDCHDPHTTRIRIKGNGLCTQCHNLAPPARFPTLKPGDYDNPDHYHHERGSEGAQCVNCHMPETTYMVVDPRRDHSFRVPRPDLNDKTSSPDACTSCHQDQSPAQAASSIQQWFGELSRANTTSHYGVTLQAARQGDPEALDGLVTLSQDTDTPDIVRATAVDALASYGTPAIPTLEQALKDDSSLVRAAAIPPFAQAPDEARVELLLPLVDDPRLAVRDEAIKALAGTSMMLIPEAQREAVVEARNDYERRLRENADLPGNRLNLAVLLERTRRRDEAAEQYRAALKLDPYFLPARVNLATLLSRSDDNEGARTTLREGVALEEMPKPDRGHLAYLLALGLAEQGQREEALEWLDKAAKWRPNHARTYYNQGLLLDRLGRKDEALSALETGLAHAPDDPDLLYALVYLHATLGHIPQALEALAQLRQQRPDDPRLQRLEGQLRGQ
ncbi:tetratricopeptide repeat protein [Halomonas binhaiensis]|uniref:Tetratricopeptide repeat protein n=1 Tax=Halomonas binhaiensis TaxID=2562282 RepID=A0A856QVH5_9GAMM|nr:tetratricopeptide repeat protein [Halomonas binhaiensis]QEM83916.2 tetratricopeptide repeat protein [Halomonas binhaiensis]